MRIKLDANDPDDNKLKFVLDSKPSHGRIAQFSINWHSHLYSQIQIITGRTTLHSKFMTELVFSNDAKVSIKIQNNEKPSNDQVKQSDKQPKKVDSNQTPRNQQKNNDGKNNGIHRKQIQANNHLLQLKTTNNQKMIKSKKSNNLSNLIHLKVTLAPVAIVNPTPESDKFSFSEK